MGTSRRRPAPADLHGRGPRPRVPARRGPRPVSARRHRTRWLGGSAAGEGVERRARRRLSDGLRAAATARRRGRARRGRGGRRHVHERLDRPGIRRRPRSGPRPAEGRVHRARDRRRGESPRAHRARRRRPTYHRWTRGCVGARLRSSPPVVGPSRDEPAADAQRPAPFRPGTYVIRILAATVSDPVESFDDTPITGILTTFPGVAFFVTDTTILIVVDAPTASSSG